MKLKVPLLYCSNPNQLIRMTGSKRCCLFQIPISNTNTIIIWLKTGHSKIRITLEITQMCHHI